MTTESLSVAYITAGAAGMYCGSCMHDNTLAAALAREGVDIQLIPTYTPIRTDEEDVTVDRIFYGGINVYLQQKLSVFRHLPGFLDRLLDQPWLIRWASRGAGRLNYKKLGELTVSMLRGDHGYQRKEVRKLVDWLAGHVKPQLVNLTNMLIAGCVPQIKEEVGAAILVTLQGDDIFLDELPEPHKSQALAEIRRLVPYVDGFLTFSNFYADYMAGYFDIPREKIHLVPLGVEVKDFAAATPHASSNHRPPTIGYLARLAPEKGLHLLVDAFLRLRQQPGTEHARLHVAGWLGESNQAYAERQFDRLRTAGLADAFHYAGVVDRRGKLDFLSGVDVLSVPTVYQDPKGLFVLEALAAGVPVVQPEHGAFPELIAATGGGRLVRPGDTEHLADTLAELLTDQQARGVLSQQGRETVHGQFDARSMAKTTLEVYRRFVKDV